MSGRKTKLTPEIHKVIVSVLRSGLPEKSAARTAGVSAKTLRRWKIRGQRGKSPEHRLLYQEMEQAKHGFECTAVATILKSGEWKGIAWLLTQLRPEIYGKKPVCKKAKQDVKVINTEEQEG